MPFHNFWPERGIVISLLILLVFTLCPGAQAKRKDLVIMKNGDHLTGEVKKLENGVLYVDLEYVSGSVGVNWLQVEKVVSTGSFQVTLKNGDRSAGTIAKVPDKDAPGKDFEVQEKKGRLQAAAPDVVEIESNKSNFWRQLSGSIDFGYNFTSGNSQKQINSDASATYLTTKWTTTNSVTASFNGQPGAPSTNLIEMQTLEGVFFNRNSLIAGLGDFLHSSQQDLDLRATLGAAYGRYFVRSNAKILNWFAGSVYTHENFARTANQQSDHNIEGLVGLQYQQFHFDRYSLTSQLFIYPGLSDAGRLRATTKATFSVKLTNNFYSDVSFWDNFDSRPPLNAKGNELGISSNLGWTF